MLRYIFLERLFKKSYTCF